MDTGDDIEKIKHMIRESYREKCWTRFSKGKRRIAQEVAGTEYNEEKCQMVRKHAESDEVLRCLAQGGFCSPAIMQRRGSKLPSHCPWCRELLGDHDHIMWECKKRPTKLPKPKMELQARVGWPGPAQNNKINSEIALWQKDVVEEVWRQRYGESQKTLKQPVAWEEEGTDSDSDSYSSGQSA